MALVDKEQSGLTRPRRWGHRVPGPYLAALVVVGAATFMVVSIAARGGVPTSDDGGDAVGVHEVGALAVPHPAEIGTSLEFVVRRSSDPSDRIISVVIRNPGGAEFDLSGWRVDVAGNVTDQRRTDDAQYLRLIESVASTQRGIRFRDGTVVPPRSSIVVYETDTVGAPCPADTTRAFFACNVLGGVRTTNDTIFGDSHALVLADASGHVVLKESDGVEVDGLVGEE